MKAHFTKLRGRQKNGRDEWGIQVVGGDELSAGDSVDVTKKNGDKSTVVVSELVARVYALEEREKSDDESPF